MTDQAQTDTIRRTAELLVFGALGALFWLTAALIVRFSSTFFFSEASPYKIGLFLLGLPVTYIFFNVAKIIGKRKPSEMLEPVVIITFTATLLDGVAMTWFQPLYGNHEVTSYGAAWILWGVGLGLLWAYVQKYRGVQR